MPSSTRSSVRSSVRRGGDVQHSFGLEDELSFGSDEDLMETIGEIDVPDADSSADPKPPSRSQAQSPPGATQPSSSGHRKPKLSKSSRTLGRSRKESSSSKTSLASTTHLLPPLPPVPAGSTLDLPTEMFGERGEKSSHKRGSLMGAFKVKGLRKWRDDQSSRASFVTDSQSMSSTVSLSKVGSNSSRPSVSSMAYTPVQPSPSSTAPHLGPLSLPSFDSTSERGIVLNAKQPPSALEHAENTAAMRSYASNGRHDTNAKATAPPAAAAGWPAPTEGRRSWTPSDISSAILPTFPANVSSLDPIAVLTAEATKRTPASGRQSSSRWSPCTVVFTLFKVSLNGEESDVEGDEERTVAHIHVFSKSSTPPNSVMRRSKSNAGFQGDAGTTRTEVERRWISRATTAAVCEDSTDVNGRGVVMRILWGDEERTDASEWLIEMKDSSYVYEWIRQIKKTAIMINAEELGYGRAIRPAYETSSVTADDLAHKLSVHARAVQREKGGVPVPSKADGAHHPPPSAGSQEGERRPSLDAAQGAALSRSRSADEAEPRAGSLGRAHRKSVSEDPGRPGVTDPEFYDGNGAQATPAAPAASVPDRDSSLAGLSLGGLNLGQQSLAFPAPPSDLPPLRSPRLPSHGSGGPPPPPRRPSPAVPTASSSNFSPAMSTSNSGLNGHPSPLVAAASRSPAMSSAPSLGVMNGSASAASLREYGMGQEVLDAGGAGVPRPPSPMRRREPSTPRNMAPSIASTTNSANSSTSRLRRLRGKPQVIDIMAEFSALEAENTPPAEDEEPIREDRERRIRFAGV